MLSYNTSGTCSRQILFDITEDKKVKNVKFVGGCSGNLQGIAKLIDGRDIEEVITALSGIKCRNNTSCPDQLAKALKKHLENLNNAK